MTDSRVGSSRLDRLLWGTPTGDDPLRHVEVLPARSASTAAWPIWTPESVRAAFECRGVSAPWPHQVEAAEHAWAGRSVVVATGTASGKSLVYQLAMSASTALDDRNRSLYLAPTKALAADQLRSLSELELPHLRAATLDGDTPLEARDWVRRHANVILTNPDMLHHRLLADHQRWASVLRRLRFVVIDECHYYRGVFGTHVSLIIRRLRRLCAAYGSDPTFILASATTTDPARSASVLTGVDTVAVESDTSPRGPRTVALWEPPLTGLRGEHDAPVRRSAGTEAARLLADLVLDGARTMAFVRSRRGAELTALEARRRLTEAGAGSLADRVAAYRGGYLAEDRRALERDLDSGVLLGVATTNALELGIDIAGLDAVIVAGYPGTLASLWQQAGRAGRRGADALVVFVARDEPLDSYLVHHPEAVFGRPVEATVLDPTNPYVLAPQLCSAAYERPISQADLRVLDGEPAMQVLDGLVAAGRLRRRPAGWYWTDRDRPAVDIRGSGGRPVTLVERGSGALIGTVDAASAPATVHAGATYLHQGLSYLVDDLDLGEGTAVLHRFDPPWTTTARSVSSIDILETTRTTEGFGRDAGVRWHHGTVCVTSQIVGFQRRRLDGQILDDTPLDMPSNRLVTAAVWYTLDDHVCAELDLPDLAGSLHAAEHAAIGLLPLFATCDRGDIGGVSTALHPDTGRATVFVHDGHPGGAGFARRGHEILAEWLTATRATIDGCRCRSGCPSCVQSPKCGNGNEPLDKAGAVRVLDTVLHALHSVA